MGLFAVQIEGSYGGKHGNLVCILLEAKDEKDAVRQGQAHFLKQFPNDYVQGFQCFKITLDATKRNPSERNPLLR